MAPASSTIFGAKVAEKNSDLTIGGDFGQYPLDVGNEAHVEHPIHLVENENLDLLQVDESLPHQVKQSTRSGYEDIDPALQSRDLVVLVDSTEDHGMPEPEKAPISFDAIPDLRRQFAGGG